MVDTATLVGLYADLLNRHGGPDSAEAKRFFEAYKENQDFRELAEMAAQLWKKHHP